MNRNGVGNDSEGIRGHSLKNDKEKRQSPIEESWRDKKAYYYTNLHKMIILAGSHTFPEEGQGFF